MSLIKNMIVQHIRKMGEESEFLPGFKERSRMEDNLFLLRCCVESSYKKGKPLIVLAIDFVKAFDSVNRETLLRALTSM